METKLQGKKIKEKKSKLRVVKKLKKKKMMK